MFGLRHTGAPPWRLLLEHLYGLYQIGDERKDPLDLQVFHHTHAANLLLEDELEFFAKKYGEICDVNDFLVGYSNYLGDGRSLVIWKLIPLQPPTRMSEDELRDFLTERFLYHLRKHQRLKRPLDAAFLAQDHRVHRAAPQNPVFHPFGHAATAQMVAPGQASRASNATLAVAHGQPDHRDASLNAPGESPRTDPNQDPADALLISISEELDSSSEAFG